MRLPTLLAGAALCGVASVPTSAAPLTTLSRPIPSLVGTWRDPQGHLCSPGVSPFESIRSPPALALDGGFTLTVDKAAGTLRQSGTYTAPEGRLTLSSLSGPVTYAVTRTGDRLTLRPLGAGAVIELTSAGTSAPSSTNMSMEQTATETSE